MSGKVLIFSHDEAGVAALGEALERAYFDVAIRQPDDPVARALLQRPDLILIDAAATAEPEVGRDWAPALCLRLRSHPTLADCAMILLAPPGAPALEAAAFDAGFDDVLPQNLPAPAAATRVRGLSRLRMMSEELRLREETSRDFGQPPVAEVEMPPLVVAVAARDSALRQKASDVARRLGGAAMTFTRGDEALAAAADTTPELVLIEADGDDDEDMAALVSAFGSLSGVGAALMSAPGGVGRPGQEAFDAAAGADALAVQFRGLLRRARLTESLKRTFEVGLRLAATDCLTGFFNRRYVDVHLKRLFESAWLSGAPLAVMLLDLDRFKSVNDKHGHAAGDAALQSFASRLRASVRRCDLVGRIGGEEFLVVMPEATLQSASAAAERVRKAMSEEGLAYHGDEIAAVTVSVGVAALMDGDETPSALIARADQALMKAKAAGRNRVVLAGAD